MKEIDDDSLNRVIGARLSMRASARLILQFLDEMTEAEVRASGWLTGEITALERLAGMQITGIYFGNWPR